MPSSNRFFDTLACLSDKREVIAFHLKNHTVVTRSINCEYGRFYFVDKWTGRVRVGDTLTNSHAMSAQWHKRLWS